MLFLSNIWGAVQIFHVLFVYAVQIFKTVFSNRSGNGFLFFITLFANSLSSSGA